MALMTMTPMIAKPSVAIPSPGCRYSERKARTDPIQRSTARKWVNWPRNRVTRCVPAASLISLNPFSLSLLAASVSERPFSELISCLRASSLERLLIFISRLQDNEVAGRLPEDFFNRVASYQGCQQSSFARPHDDQVMP